MHAPPGKGTGLAFTCTAPRHLLSVDFPPPTVTNRSHPNKLSRTVLSSSALALSDRASKAALGPLAALDGLPRAAMSELRKFASSARRPSGGLAPELDDDGPGEVHIGRLAALTTLYSLAEGTLTYPYDVVKTRKQVASPGSSVVRMTTLGYIVRLRRAGGCAALYPGFTWSVLGGVPGEVAYYVGYTEAKHAMLKTATGEANPSAVYVAAGALADVLSVLLSVPVDVVSQRLQVHGTSATPLVTAGAVSTGAQARVPTSDGVSVARAAGEEAPTGSQVVRSILRSEGLRGLWRGSAVSLALYVPHSAVWWLTHERAKCAIARRAGRQGDDTAVLGASGALAGLSATVATNPLDVLKTRVQTATQARPVGAVLWGLMKESGWRGLYSGLAPRLMVAVPRSICTVLAYERAIGLCLKGPETEYRRAELERR